MDSRWSTVESGKFVFFDLFLFLVAIVVSYCCRCADTVQRVMNLIRCVVCMVLCTRSELVVGGTV